MRDRHDSGSNDIDADAAERINDALDAIARGASPAFHLRQLDEPTAHVIDQIGRTALTDTPAPDEAFVKRLRETLMDVPMTLQANPSALSNRDGSKPVSFWRIIKGSWLSTVSTAAAILLVCVLILGTFVSGDQPHVLNLAGVAPKKPTDNAIMWGGDAGRTWNLSESNPRYGDVPQQIASSTGLTVMSALIVGDDLLMAGGDTSSTQGEMLLLSLDLRTGQENWKIPTKTWGSMASDGEHLFVFTLDPKRVTRLKPRLTAYSLSSGQELWVGDELAQLNDASFGYGPILLGGTLYASDATGNTIAVDPANGKQRWQFPQELFPAASPDTRGEDLPSSSMIGIGDAIYVVTTSKTLVKLDRQSGEQLSSTNLMDLFGSDIRTVTLQASGTELLLELQRSSTAGSDDGKTPSTPRTTIARLSSSDLSLEWQSGRGSIPGNVISLPNAFILNNTIESSGGYLISVYDPTKQFGGVHLSAVPNDSPSLMGIAGSTLIAYDNENTVTFTAQATDLSDSTPDTMSLSTGEQSSVTLPGPVKPAVIPPLLWGEIPVIVTSDGAVWSFPESAGSAGTSTATPRQDPGAALSRNSIMITIQVDLSGILNNDPVATAEAHDELVRAFAPYVNGETCQIGFALISSRSNSLGDGVELSHTVATMIEDEFPQLLPDGPKGTAPQLVSESIALPGTTPVGEVQIQLFLNQGCQPLEASPVPS